MALKLLSILVSAPLVLSKLDPPTSCCINVVSGRDIKSVDPYGPGKPYIIVTSGYERVGAPVEVDRTSAATSGMPNPVFGEEFCGGGRYQNDALRYTDHEYFQFEAWSEMTTQNNDVKIGETTKQLIRKSECCDLREQELTLRDDRNKKVGTITVQIACDYTCQTKSFSNDVKPCGGFSGAKEEDKKKEDTGIQYSDIQYSDVEVLATAKFRASDSDVEGVVEVDSNGNVVIDLTLPKLDTSDCKELEYAIYSRNDYGDLQSRRECDESKLGDLFDPFQTGLCGDKVKGDMGDMYFACATGDLSGRCGTIKVDSKGKVDIECNVSEDSNDKEGGFCNARLTPESLYDRSIAFNCKDGKAQSKLFCAPFEITNDYKP